MLRSQTEEDWRPRQGARKESQREHEEDSRRRRLHDNTEIAIERISNRSNEVKEITPENLTLAPWRRKSSAASLAHAYDVG